MTRNYFNTKSRIEKEQSRSRRRSEIRKAQRAVDARKALQFQLEKLKIQERIAIEYSLKSMK